MNKLILHIPHASDYIPDLTMYSVDQKAFKQEILKLTDWYTDDLFILNDAQTIKANFSRVFCDVERFSEDSKEIMAQCGMGVLYEKTDNGPNAKNCKSGDAKLYIKKLLLAAS